ncbi:MAG: SDR family oxidoreductase [Myxococcales bacterium]|nr:SDR family oxidoreductase [Myxococcota bacterium]MDW8281868.1 SDR family oxidoreductase [Myxococcales bacterium]
MDQPPYLRSPFRPDLCAGKVAIVTGGGTGIGRAIALELSATGAQVAVCGRRPGPIAEVEAEISARGGTCLARPCDIREPDQIEGFVQEVLARFGRIDVLVNNAGGQRPFPALDMPLVHFDKVVRNNLFGTFAMTQAVARAAMIPQGGGAIVNIIANIFRGFPGMAHTGAARAGVDNLTKSLAVEWSPYRVRVNAIAPGIIRSSGTERYPESLLEVARKKTPWKRLGTPEEVAHLCVFLASDAADYITGTTCYIDGGAALWGDLYPLPE